MGDYSYSEHLEMFGGPPEPGEAYPDAEQIDLARKAAKENPEDAADATWTPMDDGGFTHSAAVDGDA